MGPYAVGFHIVPLNDASRFGRTVLTYVWYPAIAPETPTDQQSKMSKFGWFNATPDPKAAPYPLILFSPGYTAGATSYLSLIMPLVSHGYAVAGLNHPNESDPTSLVDRPMDILFALDQLTETNKTDFSGLIDTDHVGVM